MNAVLEPETDPFLEGNYNIKPEARKKTNTAKEEIMKPENGMPENEEEWIKPNPPTVDSTSDELNKSEVNLENGSMESETEIVKPNKPF